MFGPISHDGSNALSGDRALGGHAGLEFLKLHLDPASSFGVGFGDTAFEFVQIARGRSFEASARQIEIAGVARAGEGSAIGDVIGSASQVRTNRLKASNRQSPRRAGAGRLAGRRPGESPKRIGLRCPVEITGRRGEAMIVMLRPLVVGQYRFTVRHV